jgi:adenylate cyclase
LTDALSGHHLWAERYDRKPRDIFTVQDDIAKHIVTALQVKLTEGEQARVYSKGTQNLDAYMKVMEAMWYSFQTSIEGNIRARQLAEEAIGLDPNYALAYRALGSVTIAEVWLGLSKNPQESLMKCIELYKKAITLDNSLAIVHAALGYTLTMMRRYDEALAEGEKAISLEPNSPDVLYHYGSILMFIGRREEAIPVFRKALRLNPKPPNTYYRHFGAALRDLGRYDEAIALQKKAIKQEPNDLLSYIVMAACYSLSGRMEEARAAAAEVIRVNPKFSLEQFAKTTPHKDPAVRERFIESIRKAGLK